ncbi:MAG: efflux RND transporter periplasmic adaptor subunit [Gammaproteobacteria bacterium]|nr:efflux RND transporter periplasmic adaptor subunit [Gammaproteobacteria bacterium]
MPHKRLKAFAYLLVVVAIITGLVLYNARPKPVKVSVETVSYGLVQDTVANTRAGTIKACRRAGISPSLGGQIASLPVQVGDTVEPGQVLMELWNEDRSAEVMLATREARAGNALAQQACVVAEVAEREAQRMRELRKKRLASEEAIDRADGDARAQAAACNAAQAKAEVNQARVEVVKALLDQTRLTAPFAGIVAEINGEVGEFVTPSPIGVPTPPAVDLVDITCLYVSAPIDEVDAPAIRVGMTARISLDAFSTKAFDGKVRRVAPYVLDLEKQARTVDVEVEFIDSADSNNMLPGYSADIEVILAEQISALRIPTEAILEGNRVLVVDENDLLEERTIKTGLQNWQFSEVLDGLSAEEEVVLSVDRDGVEAGALVEIESSADNND